MTVIVLYVRRAKYQKLLPRLGKHFAVYAEERP